MTYKYKCKWDSWTTRITHYNQFPEPQLSKKLQTNRVFNLKNDLSNLTEVVGANSIDATHEIDQYWLIFTLRPLKVSRIIVIVLKP